MTHARHGLPRPELLAGCFLLFFWSTPRLIAQVPTSEPKTVFGNISIDESGHVCYSESLGPDPLDRIEFRTNGKDVLSLYLSLGERTREVEVTDFNSDGRPDLIHIEWTSADGSTRTASYYRGPEYREHLRHHLLHALAATRRHLIKDRPEELQRASVIEARLQHLEATAIGTSEVGVYGDDATFSPSAHKDLRYAFIASDTLVTALRSLIDGDVRVLSRPPEVVPRYRLDLDILLAIDPIIDRMN